MAPKDLVVKEMVPESIAACSGAAGRPPSLRRAGLMRSRTPLRISSRMLPSSSDLRSIAFFLAAALGAACLAARGQPVAEVSQMFSLALRNAKERPAVNARAFVRGVGRLVFACRRSRARTPSAHSSERKVRECLRRGPSFWRARARDRKCGAADAVPAVGLVGAAAADDAGGACGRQDLPARLRIDLVGKRVVREKRAVEKTLAIGVEAEDPSRNAKAVGLGMEAPSAVEGSSERRLQVVGQMAPDAGPAAKRERLAPVEAGIVEKERIRGDPPCAEPVLSALVEVLVRHEEHEDQGRDGMVFAALRAQERAEVASADFGRRVHLMSDGTGKVGDLNAVAVDEIRFVGRDDPDVAEVDVAHEHVEPVQAPDRLEDRDGELHEVGAAPARKAFVEPVPRVRSPSLRASGSPRRSRWKRACAAARTRP